MSLQNHSRTSKHVLHLVWSVSLLNFKTIKIALKVFLFSYCFPLFAKKQTNIYILQLPCVEETAAAESKQEHLPLFREIDQVHCFSSGVRVGKRQNFYWNCTVKAADAKKGSNSKSIRKIIAKISNSKLSSTSQRNTFRRLWMRFWRMGPNTCKVYKAPSYSFYGNKWTLYSVYDKKKITFWSTREVTLPSTLLCPWAPCWLRPLTPTILFAYLVLFLFDPFRAQTYLALPSKSWPPSSFYSTSILSEKGDQVSFDAHAT